MDPCKRRDEMADQRYCILRNRDRKIIDAIGGRSAQRYCTIPYHTVWYGMVQYLWADLPPIASLLIW